MSFELKRKETPRKGVRRLILERLDLARSELAQGDLGPASEEAIHNARKCFKRIRSMLRLTSGGLGKKTRSRLDDQIRAIALRLSDARDAEVALGAFNALLPIPDEHDGRPEIETLREFCETRVRAAHQSIYQTQETRDRMLSDLDELRRDLAGLRTSRIDRRVLENGLKRIRKRCRKAYERAMEEPSEEALHEWRKRVKDLGYALEALRRRLPKAAEDWIARTRKLAEVLGDDRDLLVLKKMLVDASSPVRDSPAAAALLPLIEARRRSLDRSARRLGGALLTPQRVTCAINGTKA